MIPDPDTEEGRKEIERRTKRRRSQASDIRERAIRQVDDEPVGKLTDPNEMDLWRDRRDEE